MVQTIDRPQAFVMTEDSNEAIVFIWNGTGYSYDVQLERRWKRAQFLGSINFSGTGWYIINVQMHSISGVELGCFPSAESASNWLYNEWLDNKRRLVREALVA